VRWHLRERLAARLPDVVREHLQLLVIRTCIVFGGERECVRETRVADASSEAISNSLTALCRCAASHCSRRRMRTPPVSLHPHLHDHPRSLDHIPQYTPAVCAGRQPHAATTVLARLGRKGLVCEHLQFLVPRTCIVEQLFHRNVKRFRGGLVVKAHRWLYHSTLGSRVIKKKKKTSSFSSPAPASTNSSLPTI